MMFYCDDKIILIIEVNERGKDGECLLFVIFIMIYKILYYIYIKLYLLFVE